MEKIRFPRVGEEMYHEKLENGLNVFVFPKAGFQKGYAFFATNYGGNDTRFCLDGEWHDTPAGVAHYLEHKLFDMPEGPIQTFRIAMEDNKFSLGSFGASLSESTFWVCMIYGNFTNLQNYGIDQNYVQRYHTAKSMKEAKFSALFGGYLFIPVSAIFFLIGTGLYAFYKVNPGMLPEGMGADFVFPFFIVNELPVGLTGLLIASIFAAGMSTVATSVTSSSTIFLTDYYMHFRKNAGNREKLLVLKGASVMVGILGALVAFAFMNAESALDAWWALSSIFSGGMLGLFLLGYLSKKARHIDAAIGVACGLVALIWAVVDPLVHANLAIVFGTILVFLVGFLCSKILNKN